MPSHGSIAEVTQDIDQTHYIRLECNNLELIINILICLLNTRNLCINVNRVSEIPLRLIYLIKQNMEHTKQ